MPDHPIFNTRFVEAVGWLESLVSQSKQWAADAPTDDPDADFECIKECEWLSERLRQIVDAFADPTTGGEAQNFDDDTPL